jgi:hypothetical protein
LLRDISVGAVHTPLKQFSKTSSAPLSGKQHKTWLLHRFWRFQFGPIQVALASTRFRRIILPASPAIGNIATVNELGALVLGLIGGYGGKHLWEHLTSA